MQIVLTDINQSTTIWRIQFHIALSLVLHSWIRFCQEFSVKAISLIKSNIHKTYPTKVRRVKQTFIPCYCAIENALPLQIQRFYILSLKMTSSDPCRDENRLKTLKNPADIISGPSLRCIAWEEAQVNNRKYTLERTSILHLTNKVLA